MKTSCFRLLALLLVVLAVASCTQKPYEMLTTVHADGSCTREFTLEADSLFIMGDSAILSRELAIQLDSNWVVNWKVGDGKLDERFPIDQHIYDSIQAGMPWQTDEITGKRYQSLPSFKVTLSRTFTSMQDMEAHYRIKPNSPWSKLHIRYHLEKQFRWFYTYFTYRETYSAIDLGFSLPIDSFMTADEARFWFTGSPNLLNGMNGIEIRDFTGTLEDKYTNWFTTNLKLQQSNTPKDSAGFNLLFSFSRESYKYRLTLPGTMLQTENAVLNENIQSGPITAERLLYDDYVIEARSRKANVWAFIVSGLVVALAIFGLFYKPKRRKITHF